MESTNNAASGAFSGQRVVVTGATGGIGRAISTRLVNEGAQVLINDLNPETCAELAEQIGAQFHAGDAASEEGVAALIAAADSALGGIDMFVANAGIGVVRGLDATEDDWARSFDVNVMAHVRTARVLVPRWLEAGGGRFVVTASAAGLLTMLGDAPYSVTKHGAVAFAEWLSATYGAQGIAVHAICPQGVRTAMYEESGPLRVILDKHPIIDPPVVADALVQAIADGHFFVLPHPEVADFYSFRATRTDRWLQGMQSMQVELLDGVTD